MNKPNPIHLTTVKTSLIRICCAQKIQIKTILCGCLVSLRGQIKPEICLSFWGFNSFFSLMAISMLFIWESPRRVNWRKRNVAVVCQRIMNDQIIIIIITLFIIALISWAHGALQCKKGENEIIYISQAWNLFTIRWWTFPCCLGLRREFSFQSLSEVLKINK